MAISVPGVRLAAAVPLLFVSATRARRSHSRAPGGGLLNLTPFVDLLVLLVVFFLPQLHASAALTCTCKAPVRLPMVAHHFRDLEAAPIVTISGDAVTLDGRVVLTIDLDEVDAPPPDPRLGRQPIAALHEQLVTLKQNFRLLHPDADFLGMVNLQIDRRVDFQLVKRVMYTCRLAGYDNLNFAVQHKE